MRNSYFSSLIFALLASFALVTQAAPPTDGQAPSSVIAGQSVVVN